MMAIFRFNTRPENGVFIDGRQFDRFYVLAASMEQALRGVRRIAGVKAEAVEELGPVIQVDEETGREWGEDQRLKEAAVAETRPERQITLADESPVTVTASQINQTIIDVFNLTRRP